MKKNKIFFAFALLFAVHLNTFALHPTRCPSIASIQKFGITELDEEANGLWTAYHPYDHYDGDYPVWGFEMHSIPGKTVQEAYHNAITRLTTLAFIGGPYISKVGLTLCKYQTKQQNPSFLFTPIFEAS